MAGASYVQTSFLGGELSQFAQGRFEKPDYRISLNVCLNAFPVEIGPWTRRPGTKYAGHTRDGKPGRVIKFDFEQAAPYTLEFTDGYMRARNGASFASTNDTQVVVAVSTANPAVVQVTNAVAWSSGDTLVFPGASTPLLENRQFTATKIDTTHFSLADALTGATIDGSTLGALAAGVTVERVQEIVTPYTLGLWSSVRAIQAIQSPTVEALILHGSVAPQSLTVTTLPTAATDAQFSLATANFIDGPYLDPIAGTTITPDGATGLINLTLGFQIYSSATAYSKGDYVSSSGVGYQSLVDGNAGHTPASSPTYWKSVALTSGVNSGQGFLSSDIGRHIRLYNAAQPSAWSNATTYNAGDIVTSSSVVYQSLLGGNLNNTPSTTSAYWKTYTPGWTWGKITAMSSTGLISAGLGSTIGTFNNASRAFDGTASQPSSSCATVTATTAYIGKNFTGSAQAINFAIVNPASDVGFASSQKGSTLTLALYASNSAPTSYNNGTLLGSVVLPSGGQLTPVTISSNNNVTTYNYVWVAYVWPGIESPPLLNCAELQFFNASGTPGLVAQVQLIGAPLPNTSTMPTWRFGAFSTTTGWPNCGCYDEGRLWLAGAIANRFDASVANGISGNNINFAPTDSSGAVTESNAISYTLNADGTNPILWMEPDLQGIIVGTQAEEYLIVAPTSGPLAPDNIAARRVTKIGCANILPCRTEHTTVFVQRYALKLPEYFPDIFSGKFSAPNLADKMQHITRNGIAEIAYTNASTPVIWGRDTQGSLFGITYKRDSLASSQPPTYYAGHRHALGSGRIVESICSGPSVDGNLDTLTMVTNDTTTGIRHVELLTDAPDELSALANAWFLDDAVAPTSTSSSVTAVTGAPYGGLTINGLWHLNGKTVQVFAGGLDCGDRGDNLTTCTDFVVSNGSVFVPYGDGVSAGSGRGLFTAAFAATNPPIVAGFTYNSDGQLVRPVTMQDTGARNGSGFAKKRRNHRVAMQLVNTRGISVGVSFSNLKPASLRKDDDATQIGTLDVFNGIYQDAIDDDYSYDGMICWRVSRPMPATVVVAGGNIETQDQ